jgi:hypothetical protein
MSSEVPVAEGTSVVTGQRSALRRSALRAVRRDTAVTAESAWCSAFAVRVDGSRRPAASARRWTSARVSGRAMASSSHVRRRLEKNAHMLRVPSSSLRKVPRRYPHCPGLTTSRAVWQLAGAGKRLPAITVRRYSAGARCRPNMFRPITYAPGGRMSHSFAALSASLALGSPICQPCSSRPACPRGPAGSGPARRRSRQATSTCGRWRPASRAS